MKSAQVKIERERKSATSLVELLILKFHIRAQARVVSKLMLISVVLSCVRGLAAKRSGRKWV